MKAFLSLLPLFLACTVADSVCDYSTATDITNVAGNLIKFSTDITDKVREANLEAQARGDDFLCPSGQVCMNNDGILSCVDPVTGDWTSPGGSKGNGFNNVMTLSDGVVTTITEGLYASAVEMGTSLRDIASSVTDALSGESTTVLALSTLTGDDLATPTALFLTSGGRTTTVETSSTTTTTTASHTRSHTQTHQPEETGDGDMLKVGWVMGAAAMALHGLV
ncbi:hypothetical protein NA57DRAFT_59671 [Rhizodiscina lignyota]|uniref:Uncharacterized protein n=1 Tax=Rhizodiscina lignyota TaxID=1504668 RepID=A0A9P4IAH0_9PEZI|nr:hypothetical protein NA57DRAFT_59671 [Rhizodiscina lignyota]